MGFFDTKDFVFSIAFGVAGDLSACAGRAGDDGTAHGFAAKYEPAARSIVSAIGTAGHLILSDGDPEFWADTIVWFLGLLPADADAVADVASASLRLHRGTSQPHAGDPSPSSLA
ncbi:hypothetical protein ACFY1U_28940 [Streptomyces sp. NPDC001351]|uniref:hypothetical protein n=1 Tax=Streptomyces sp. NPDC001351 TaxID=3364564 RepID=UPI00368CD03E